MPKFKRSCNNPFYKEWSKNDEGGIVNLTSRGLLSLSKPFERFIEAELAKKVPRGVKYFCTISFRECFKKRKFTKFISNDLPELERKVQRQVCNFAKVNYDQRKKLPFDKKKVDKKISSTYTIITFSN